MSNMNKKMIIEALSMDLKRIALGLQKGSSTMVERFKEEALKREQELRKYPLDSYLKKLVIKTRQVLIKKDGREAEDALMYSTLFQNYVQKNLR